MNKVLFVRMGAVEDRWNYICPHCQREAGDEATHIVLQCVAWATERQRLLGKWISKFRRSQGSDAAQRQEDFGALYSLAGGKVRVANLQYREVRRGFLYGGAREGINQGGGLDADESDTESDEEEENPPVASGLGQKPAGPISLAEHNEMLHEEKMEIALAHERVQNLEEPNQELPEPEQGEDDDGSGPDRPLFAAMAEFLQTIEPGRRATLAELQRQKLR